MHDDETPPPPPEDPPQPPVHEPGAERAAASVGKWLVKAGRFTGRSVADAYRAVDPDLRRHIAHLPLLGYSLFGSRTEPLKAKKPDGYAPLVFVHGLGGSRGDFLPLASYLRLHGRKRSYRQHYPAGQSIEQRSERLVDFVHKVIDLTEEPQVEIVAHSLGGLVVRLALTEMGLAPCVRLLITLGTPHAGTFAARFADTLNTRELRPDSCLIERLNRQPWPEEVAGVSFWSQSDLMILPPQSAVLEGTEAVDATPFTHYSYLIDPRSWEMVRQRLEFLAAT